jgi:hypothetical protein
LGTDAVSQRSQDPPALVLHRRRARWGNHHVSASFRQLGGNNAGFKKEGSAVGRGSLDPAVAYPEASVSDITNPTQFFAFFSAMLDNKGLQKSLLACNDLVVRLIIPKFVRDLCKAFLYSQINQGSELLQSVERLIQQLEENLGPAVMVGEPNYLVWAYTIAARILRGQSRHAEAEAFEKKSEEGPVSDLIADKLREMGITR